MDTIQQAQALCAECSVTDILKDLALPRATYYRWLERAAGNQLADRVVVPQR